MQPYSIPKSIEINFLKDRAPETKRRDLQNQHSSVVNSSPEQRQVLNGNHKVVVESEWTLLNVAPPPDFPLALLL